LGRNLGSCWIDLRTVTRAIKSTDFREDITSQFGTALTIDDTNAGRLYDLIEDKIVVTNTIPGYFTESFDNFVFGNLAYRNFNNEEFDNSMIQVNNLVEVNHELKKIIDENEQVSYRDLTNYNFGTYGKLSKIRIAQVYYAIGSYLMNKKITSENPNSNNVNNIVSKSIISQNNKLIILFDEDSADVEDIDSFLSEFGKLLNSFNKNSAVEISLSGYASTDESSSSSLARKRVVSVSKILKSNFGDYTFILPKNIIFEETNKFRGASQNRRVEIEVLSSDNSESTQLNRQNNEEVSIGCSECGNGLFNLCDIEECHSLGTECYFTKISYKRGILPYSANSCIKIPQYIYCEDFIDDPIICARELCRYNEDAISNTFKCMSSNANSNDLSSGENIDQGALLSI